MERPIARRNLGLDRNRCITGPHAAIVGVRPAVAGRTGCNIQNDAMRHIAHISDLHFDRIDPVIVDALLGDLEQRKPDLIIISGDLTQRARTHQFIAARSFLKRLEAPYLVVPGNHDIAPFFRPLTRAFDPFGRFRRYIHDDLCPIFTDDEIAVVGLNTARAYRWKEGSLSPRQVDKVRRIMAPLDDGLFKIVFTHHPFLPPPDSPDTSLVNHARSSLRVFESVSVDLLLAGHLHRAYTGDVTKHYSTIRRSILVAQASTATSTRLRAEPNAYNWITIDGMRTHLQANTWDGVAFKGMEKESFVKVDNLWHPERVSKAFGGSSE
jgi:3',5'-cyclic AMP phosphodiesterase CpdA